MLANPQVFSTEQVAGLIGLDPKKDSWRILKFAESREYGIQPSISSPRGSGSRRLYDLGNVCEFALALRLLETGMRSAAIGKVLKQVKGKLVARLQTAEKSLYLVIIRTPHPGKPLAEKRPQEVRFAEDIGAATKILKSRRDDDVLFIPVGSMLRGLRTNSEVVSNAVYSPKLSFRT
jgi:hypothetical protein